MDNHRLSCYQLGHYFKIDGKQLQEQYKDHISDFHQWDQKEHAADWMVFASNMGEYLSIDETALSGGELYTIVTNKAAKGRKGSIIAMHKGTQAEQIIATLERIPFRQRNKVKEVTLDMAVNMAKAIRRCFPSARRVIDRFHVQKLASDAVQELRIRYRWEVLDQENQQVAQARKSKQTYQPEILSNGDTLKQLLARSRYLLFKHESKWSPSQRERADILFPRYPLLHKGISACYPVKQHLYHV